MENELLTEARKAAEALISCCLEKKLTLATAESCTGGLLGAILTSFPGVSEVYLGGVVSYANEVKTRLLGVGEETLAAVGAVSPETGRAMAEGALRAVGASLAVSVTGIAGPGGGSEEKPVGLVYVTVTDGHTVTVTKNLFSGGREEVRLKTARRAFSLLLEAAAYDGPSSRAGLEIKS